MNKEEYTIARSISILFRSGQNYVSKQLEDYNIGRGQNLILLTLFKNEGIRQENLASHLRIDKGSIAKSIKKLEDEGYIERSIDAEDKRAYKVYLTQKAIDIIPKIKEVIRSWEESIVAELNEDEKGTMKQLLNKMAAKAYHLK
jgi:Transcriptional regulators